MRSAVQSCVPLQESTAKRCAFFVYIDILAKRSGCWFRDMWACSQMDLKQLTGNERSEWMSICYRKENQCILRFLGYHTTGQKGLEGAARGDWNILRPATWKSSTYETFVSAFLMPVNTAWTPNLLIAFNFHYFHKWLVGRSERGFVSEFRFCQKPAQLCVPSSPSSSRGIFTSEIELLTSLYFHAILGPVNTAVNTKVSKPHKFYVNLHHIITNTHGTRLHFNRSGRFPI